MNEIFSKILELAQNCKKDGTVMTRADLAYELQDLGITEDSSEICILVYKAYMKYNDQSIATSFVTNDKAKTLIDAYSVMNNIGNNVDDTFQNISQHTKNGQASLQKLEKNINSILRTKASSNETSFLTQISGTQGAINIQNSANKFFEKYTNLIGCYENAKADVKESMVDFVFLREHIHSFFMKHSLELVDIFGDSIKAIAPEMFDFDSVEWLDVKDMMNTISLEYDTISNSCANLISSITDNFQASLKASVSSYKTAGNRNVGLTLAGLNLIGHYMDSASKTTALKQDLLSFTNKIKKDATTIKGDMGRLFVIFRTINELYIPKADAFCQYAEKVMSPEMNNLIGTLYATPILRDIKARRDEVLTSLKAAENKQLDAQLNIDIYTASCASYKQLLDSNRSNYENAKASKPSKPFFLFNLLSLGTLGTKYNREISEWYSQSAPAIRYYEDLMTDLKLDSEELEKQKNIHKEETRNIKKLKREADKLSSELRNRLSESPEIKKNILPHLEDIIRLLKIAKDIVSSKLDEKYIKAVTIKEYQSNELPESFVSNINDFAENLKEKLRIGQDEFIAKPTTVEIITDNGEKQLVDIPDTGITKEESTALADAANNVINNTANLLAEACKLEAMKKESRITDKIYAEQLSVLQSEFQQQMRKISNQGDILRESLRRINTAADADDLKNGLLSLSSNRYNLSEDELNDFLKGTRTIEI